MARSGPIPVRLTRLAADDLAEAFACVEARNRIAAVRLAEQLRSGVERLGAHPLIGVALSPEDYELVAPGIRFIAVEPYVVFYRATPDAVVVLRILHSRRDYLSELLGQ